MVRPARVLLAAFGLVLVVAACGGESDVQPFDAAGEAAVEVAYRDAWDVRDEALHRQDLALLGARFADEDPAEVVGGLAPGAPSAHAIVSASVAARIDAGLDVRGGVDHEIMAIDIADAGDAAQVSVRITDSSYLVSRATGVRQTSAETETYEEVWFLVLRDGEWKAVYFARQ